MAESRRRALVTGISGQDGSYLTELLLQKGYEVHGMVRRQSIAESQDARLWHLADHEHLHTYYGDVTDVASVYRVMRAAMPDEVYNLAAQSHVWVSFQKPWYTSQVNAIGALNVLEAACEVNRHVRYYQASVAASEPVLIRKAGIVSLIDAGDAIGLCDFEILTHDPTAGRCTFAPVAQVLDHGSRQTYCVSGHGKATVRVTADHSLFTWDSAGQLSAKKVSQIRAGDFMATCCGQITNNAGLPEENVEYVLKHHIPNRYHGTLRVEEKAVQRTIKITPAVARLCGYYVAEGYTNCAHRSERVAWTFGNSARDPGRIEDTAAIIGYVFGKKVNRACRKSSTIVTLCGKEAAAFFSRFGCSAYEKHLPWFIWSLPRDSVIEFLRGYACDAKIGRGGDCVFSTVSRRLQREVAYLCRINDIPARIFQRRCKAHEAPQGGMIRATDLYDVHVPTGYIFGHVTKGTRSPMPTCLPVSVIANSPLARTMIPATHISQMCYKQVVGRKRIRKFVDDSLIVDPGLGACRVDSIEPSIMCKVVDFEVAGAERFFCGSLPLLAHNSSSEMYGNAIPAGEAANEQTPMRPVSPYGIAKLFAYHQVRRKRAEGFHCSNGILFNHTSPRRGRAFVEMKIVDSLLKRAYLSGPPLVLGNVAAKRDFGHSRDYVRAMWLMLQQDKPGDYVIGTGNTTSINEIVATVLQRLDMLWGGNVETAPRYERPVELHYLRARASKAMDVLGWKRTSTLPEILEEMLKVRGEELGIGDDVKYMLKETER